LRETDFIALTRHRLNEGDSSWTFSLWQNVKLRLHSPHSRELAATAPPAVRTAQAAARSLWHFFFTLPGCLGGGSKLHQPYSYSKIHLWRKQQTANTKSRTAKEVATMTYPPMQRQTLKITATAL